ncbi:hypothetical protein [Singulisphaera acidiphila]|uniref:Uncharacterized protein n=1 Tax=Singulisphaera acidiphila (strain ATCC BAA-1392 / DSM 18658 / VKM B-2454 / MOB10) TaxID=886293 RepID=L0DDP5_SINAD|nr:hypothetical protein [Singulisphaera acidiphila]AGA27499.1 hypothetical protein Sinac_3227 [Singulisphaera acidiphila DSM 18658]
MRDVASDIVFTLVVKAIQERKGFRQSYARMEVMPVTVHLLDEPAQPGAGGCDAAELRQRHMDFLKPSQG